MTFASPTDEPTNAPFRVCFVCSGNICRSPMAEVVFRTLAERAGLGDRIVSSSAGTGDWHVGEKADDRTIAALAKKGYDGSAHRARQFESEWFEELDLVVALDRSHQRILDSWGADADQRAKVQLLLSFDPAHPASLDVPDPYYSNAAMFDTVLELVERACTALFSQLEPALRTRITKEAR